MVTIDNPLNQITLVGGPSGISYRKDFKDYQGFQPYYSAMYHKSHFYKFHVLEEFGWN